MGTFATTAKARYFKTNVAPGLDVATFVFPVSTCNWNVDWMEGQILRIVINISVASVGDGSLTLFDAVGTPLYLGQSLAYDYTQELIPSHGVSPLANRLPVYVVGPVSLSLDSSTVGGVLTTTNFGNVKIFLAV